MKMTYWKTVVQNTNCSQKSLHLCKYSDVIFDDIYNHRFVPSSNTAA